MTRYVKRRGPKPKPPPWEWKGVWETGPPKTVLSNWYRPVVHRLTTQSSVVLGNLDPLLRLYRREEPAETLMGHEWAEIKDSVDWIEMVDADEHIVLRISMKSAKMSGRATRHGWRIPLDHYTVYEQEHRL